MIQKYILKRFFDDFIYWEFFFLLRILARAFGELIQSIYKILILYLGYWGFFIYSEFFITRSIWVRCRLGLLAFL